MEIVTVYQNSQSLRSWGEAGFRNGGGGASRSKRSIAAPSHVKRQKLSPKTPTKPEKTPQNQGISPIFPLKSPKTRDFLPLSRETPAPPVFPPPQGSPSHPAQVIEARQELFSPRRSLPAGGRWSALIVPAHLQAGLEFSPTLEKNDAKIPAPMKFISHFTP